MSDFDLLSVTLEDFRSVKGQVTIPLDAPIVLIHGVNGAGKSSVLSAIELALTGSAAGLTRSENGETRHLVHRGCQQASVSLKSRLDGDEVNTDIAVDSDGLITGQAALTLEDRRTFVERCYLAQATVGRLLEIYQNKVHGQSPLTRFVKDLLGLDRLEALIDGLHPAGDIRRLRNLTPALMELESEERRLAHLQEAVTSRFTDARAAVRDASDDLAQALADGTPAAAEVRPRSPAELLEAEFPDDRPGPSMQLLVATKQELDGLLARAGTIPASEQDGIAALEGRARAAEEALEQWQSAVGQNLERVLEAVNTQFPTLPLLSTGPIRALQSALNQLEVEIRRASELLEADQEATRQIASVTEQLGKAQARAERLLGALSDEPDRVMQLTRSLAELATHLSGDACPVCGRDYSEVSAQPLHEHLAKRIASLSSEGKRLQEVIEALQEAKGDERSLVAHHNSLQYEELTPGARLETRRTLSDLRETQQILLDLSPRVEEGAGLASAAKEARTDLLDAHNVVNRAAEIRLAVSRTANFLDAAPLGDTESLDHGIARLLYDVGDRISTQVAYHSHRARVSALRQALSRSLDEEAKLTQEVARLDEQWATCRSARAAFEGRRSLARALASEAEAAKARVVRQVFNHSLNRVWRELFVRLVPSEPFVPAFRIVTGSGGAVAAELETQHRDGGIGGNPSYMLSAGNLNTGAVTLFLALHLSVSPRLPWLILDDPVQSMDEVHIAQFAALLRTLAKRGGRKVVIAVHERSLFDYLALELSPAFQGDKLITVELSRPDGGVTETNPEFITWQEDHALSAS